MSYIKKIPWLAGAALLLVSVSMAGCTKDNTAAPQASPSPAAPAAGNQDALNLRMAGGKFGSDSIAFIGGGSSNKLWVVDAKYHKLISMIDVGGPKLERTKKLYPDLHDTHAMTFTKDFKIFLTVDWFNYDEPSQVIAYDTKTFNELWRAPAGKGGHHCALSPDDKFLYVANQHEGTISVIDMATHKKIKDLNVGKGPDYISPSMYWDGKAIPSQYLYASIDGESKVSVIDTKTNEIAKDIKVEAAMHGVNLTPDGKQVWVCVMGGKHVAVIDTATKEVKDKIPFNEAPIHLSFSPDGKFAYVTTGGNQIFKVDTATYKQLWKSIGTTIPAHTGVSPDGRELWTLNHGMEPKRYPYQIAGDIVYGAQIWDTENGDLVNEIPAEGMPHEIQFIPYAAMGVAPADQGGHTGGGHSEGADPAAKAQAVYKQSCVACHADDLKGKSGPNLTKIGGKYTQEELQNIILKGKGMMPSGLVNETDAKLLAEWLSKMK